MGAMQQMLLGIGSSSSTTYATWNPSDKDVGITLSNGNLTASNNTASKGVRATIGKSTGKWYWEISVTTVNELDVGIATSTASLATWLGADAQGVGYDELDGHLYKNNAAVTNYATYASGDVLGFALDADAGTLKVYKNNSLQGTYTHGLTGTIYPAMGSFGVSAACTANFGATALTYTPPTGYNSGIYN